MKLVPLRKLIDSLDSGARPKGGVSNSSGTVPSLGGEHLNSDGGFDWSNPKYIEEDFYCSMDRGRVVRKNILIVKDGATTGKVSFVGDDFPFERSAVNEHVFRLAINEDVAVPEYVFRFLHSGQGTKELLKDFRGATVGGISRDILDKAHIPLPATKEEQRRLAAILDKADAIRRKRREALKLADEFLRTAFLDLFGDPVSNPKGWPEVPVKELATVTTGNTPSREVTEFYGDHIEWIKSDNINTPNHYLTAATECLSEKGFDVGRWVPAGATLITCIAGSPACIGNAALADRPVAFNQQINALTPKGDIESEFLYALVLYSKRRIQAASTEGMKGMVSKGSLEQIHLISPDQALRRRFTNVFHKVMHSVERLGKSLHEAEALFQSLSHRAFQGTL